MKMAAKINKKKWPKNATMNSTGYTSDNRQSTK
jgi:hypothetical protein